KREYVMKCIYCFEKMIISLSWENIIIGSKQKKLCLSCIKSFERLTNPLCTICSTESSSDKCFDCLEWAKKYTNQEDRKSTRLNSSHVSISYAVFCLKK